MADEFMAGTNWTETHNPILKTIWIVEDRIAEILEMGKLKLTVSRIVN